MTKDELIVKQQLEIEEYKAQLTENKEILKTLHYKFAGIGQPLNDNVLKFNSDQIRWCLQIQNLIEGLN